MPRSIATRQADLFYDQRIEQLNIEGIPPVTTLVAGYQLDMYEQSIDVCMITCPIGGNLHWTMDIRNPFEVVEEIETINPKKSTDRKIKPKKIIKKLRENNDD